MGKLITSLTILFLMFLLLAGLTALNDAISQIPDQNIQNEVVTFDSEVTFLINDIEANPMYGNSSTG
jgi:hypothetical protein